MPVAKPLLRPGNRKLGSERIWSFSIPAYHTCRPGRTEVCARLCYARRLEGFRPSLRGALRGNLKATRSDDFVGRVVAEITARKVKLLRVHSAGDLYSAGYAAKWLAVFRRTPGTLHYLYSRSWRDAATRAVLGEMSRLRNVRVWFSTDRMTGDPGRVPRRVRIAYLQDGPGDVPARADLVFRPRKLRKEVRKSLTTQSGRAPVCPTETGAPGAHAVTCETCRSCWRPDPPPARGRTPLKVI